MKIKRLAGVLVAAVMCGSAVQGQPAAAPSRDPIIEATDGLFSLMLADNRADASLILTALRSTRDPALLPVFERAAQRTEPEMQLGGMVAMAVASKDSSKFNLEKALGNTNTAMVRAAISLLVDEKLLTNEQLIALMTTSTDSTVKIMAASELERRKVLPLRKTLLDMLKDPQAAVRYYAGAALLESADAGEVKQALDTLMATTWPPAEADRYNPRDLGTQAILLLRIRKDKLVNGVPWVVALTKDDKMDEALRMAAMETLLELQRSEGVEALGRMVANPPKIASRQIRVALMALQYAPQLKGSMIAPLEKSDSRILATTATLAHQAADGVDVTAGLVKLLNEGQPFIMDWALIYAETAPPERQMLLWKTLVENSAIVDDVHARDFERAAVAAEKIATQNTPAGRATLKGYLRSDNRAIVEAVLAGIYRSTAPDQAELVADFWTRFSEHQSGPYENAANYAALIMARDGKPAVKSWLGGMVQGGTVQDIGFRALAGWYYAKLTGQADALAKRFAERK